MFEATVLMAESSSAKADFFDTKLEAPAFSISQTERLSSCSESAITFVSGICFVIWRVASMPLRSGMSVSIMMMSGFNSFASLTASRPFSAYATTSIPSSLLSRVPMASDRILWSSAISIFIAIVIFLCF